MSLKFCQGPDCHTYTTKDRLKGPKENKTYQTRRRSHMYYGRGNFCDRRCMEDWVAQYIDQALDHYGRTTEAKHLTEHNAWTKDYDYNWRNEGNAGPEASRSGCLYAIGLKVSMGAIGSQNASQTLSRCEGNHWQTSCSF